MKGDMNNYGRRRRVRRRPVPMKYRVTAVAIVILYVLLLSGITYAMLYKPSGNSDRTFVEHVTDENGNIVTVEHSYEALDGTYNILMLGLDKEAMLTDVFMLVNINNNTGAVTVMQLPRDTYITSVDGVSNNTHKINELFADHYIKRSNAGEKEPYLESLLDVTKLIEDNLCIDISNSAIMDLSGFRNIVDILGGVEVDVPADMYYSDPVQNLYINIPAGRQTLDGAAAEGFVRFRSGYAMADLGRQNAQKIFLAALFDKVKSSISITNVPRLTELAGEIYSNLTTDMTASDVLFFGKSLLACDLSGIAMQTMPGNTNDTHYVINRSAAMEALNKSYNIYNKKITDGIFDKNGMFNNCDDVSVSQIYYASPDSIYDTNVYNGADVISDSIDIPRK